MGRGDSIIVDLRPDSDTVYPAEFQQPVDQQIELPAHSKASGLNSTRLPVALVLHESVAIGRIRTDSWSLVHSGDCF